ncbi:DUF3102 domain-containing protein [Bradyrhizobium sp. A11]|uniref:DUF3102 domain-containing protein n=1 Tax=Bradyrhizobium sp. A11 TaxID=3133974 RepID=UPI003245F38C
MNVVGEVGGDLSVAPARLRELAATIRHEHEAAAEAVRRGLNHAIAAGQLLNEAKVLLRHGEWLPWLRDHCAISDRTARLYMSLAKNRDLLDGQIGNVADLSVRGAAALIASRRQPSEFLQVVPMVFDGALDELETIDLEVAKVEREKRRAIFAAIGNALKQIMASTDSRSQGAAEVAWALHGDRLLSAIADCKERLLSGDARGATAACQVAANIVSQMLERVDGVAGPSGV